jgi:hypothetical protein
MDVPVGQGFVGVGLLPECDDFISRQYGYARTSPQAGQVVKLVRGTTDRSHVATHAQLAALPGIAREISAV